MNSLNINMNKSSYIFGGFGFEDVYKKGKYILTKSKNLNENTDNKKPSYKFSLIKENKNGKRYDLSPTFIYNKGFLDKYSNISCDEYEKIFNVFFGEYRNTLLKLIEVNRASLKDFHNLNSSYVINFNNLSLGVIHKPNYNTYNGSFDKQLKNISLLFNNNSTLIDFDVEHNFFVDQDLNMLFYYLIDGNQSIIPNSFNDNIKYDYSIDFNMYILTLNEIIGKTFNIYDNHHIILDARKYFDFDMNCFAIELKTNISDRINVRSEFDFFNNLIDTEANLPQKYNFEVFKNKLKYES